MATHHPPDLEAAANDLVASSPRSDLHPHVRFMCSFGGKILPRPHDNLLRYVGGDTRIIAVQRATTFNALLNKLSKLSGTTNITVKYQLPNEDLDALISVTTDEDVENMMEEYDRVAQNQNPRTARLRLFLFNKGDDSQASSIGSLLDSSSNREQWFLEALNGGGGSPPLGPGLERLRSEASSIVSEVPDYLFGLEISEENQPREPKSKARSVLLETVSISDPGSPIPVANSPYCSTSSACVPSMPDLPPVKTKPENPVPRSDPKESESFEEMGETIVVQPGNPAGYYAPSSHYSGPPMQHMPVYYIPSPMPPSNMSVPPIMARGPYVQHQQYPASVGQIPVGYHQPGPSPGQMYGGVVRSVVADGVSHQVYYGVSNGGMVSTYPPGMVVPAPGGEDIQVVAAEAKPGRISQQS